MIAYPLALALVALAFLIGLGCALGYTDLRRTRREEQWLRDRYAVIGGEAVVLCSVRIGEVPGDALV